MRHLLRLLLIQVTLLLGSPAWAGTDGSAVAVRGDDLHTGSDPAAMTRMAQRYEHAEGVEKDFARANQLYCRAAKAGHAEAQFRLGWIYANGRGVARDDGVAAVLFVMAAEQGHEYARRLLQYVRAQPNTDLPSCLLPERVEPVHVAVEEPAIEIRGRPEIEALVKQLAPQYAIDPQLVMALISVESGFNPKAVSPKNAQGLMQLIPETAQRFGVQKVFNPADNIRGGLAYLRWLMAFFQGEVKLVLAAYNAGERAVERHKGIPPYEETKSYVQRISSMYKKLTHPYSAEVVAPSPVLSAMRRGGG
ncbi:MAG: transglycosylase SLT domain-containing protein [Burkholderiales bacterium]|nr:transglycosylase SLT domain-containing protein [Burkholderiales bacterium]